MKNKGLFSKYTISKTDGTPINENAIYFVLRLDTDEAARKAIKEYCNFTDDKELSNDLLNLLDYIEENNQ